MRRLSALLGVAVTVASFAVAGTRTASALPLGAHRPGASHGAGNGPTVAAQLRRLAQSPKVQAARQRPAATTAAPKAAHLDPKTGALAPDAGGNVRVAVSGSQLAVTAAATAVGGRALAFYKGRTSVIVAKTKLAALANRPGVTSIVPANRAHELDAPGPTQATGPSGAAQWVTAGTNGAGVKIAVVDMGFKYFAGEVTAHHLAAEPIVNTDCADPGTTTPDVNQTEHGTAVFEIVYQMAPGADIFPYCVETTSGFGAAVDDILAYNAAHPAAPITIATSSLGFYLDSRGDGSDPGYVDPSAAQAVATARKAGVLWFQSAGNDAADHWGGQLYDADHNGFIDLHGPFSNDQDAVIVPPGGTASFYLQWDEWPVSSAGLALSYQVGTCSSVDCQNSGDPVTVSGEIDTPQTAGSSPGIGVDVQNSTSEGQVYYIGIKDTGAFLAGARYDLAYVDSVSESLNACSNDDAHLLDPCVHVPGAAADSVTSPANSPFAVAVGAHDVNDTVNPSSTEDFSSQGPTIDGRVKPDIIGYDGTNSWIYNDNDFFFPPHSGFFGTSAAAPHVAGAAVLVKAKNPTWDASQIQNFLEQRANNGAPVVPPTNATGAGLLTLGAPATAALPASGQYNPLPKPVRILDTRTPLGGHLGKLGAGGTATVDLTKPPAGLAPLPADATAVAINLTGVGASARTFLAAYPGGTAFPGTSNLNLTTTDATAAVFAIVSVNAARSITVRNNAGLVNAVVDELGFFRTNPVGGGLYTPQTPHRELDTRTTIGGHPGKVPSFGALSVNPKVPSGSTAAIVNITEVNSQTSGGYVTAAPACTTATSTLDFNRTTRANLAIVTLQTNGTFCLANYAGATDLIVDVLGYMGPTGASYVGLPAPRRIMDTRTGTGPVARPFILAHGIDVVTGAGVGEVPYTATALLTGVTEVTATAPSYLQTFAGPTRPADKTSTLDFIPGQVMPNAAVVGVGSGGQIGIYNDLGNTAVAVDLFGYFR